MVYHKMGYKIIVKIFVDGVNGNNRGACMYLEWHSFPHVAQANVIRQFGNKDRMKDGEAMTSGSICHVAAMVLNVPGRIVIRNTRTVMVRLLRQLPIVS